MKLTDLVVRAKGEVVDIHEWVSDTAWTQAAKDAVLEVSRKRAMKSPLTITAEAGRDEYPLPNDFLFMIDFPTSNKWRDGDILNTPGGIIPLSTSQTFPEEVYVRGKNLIIVPAPQYAYTLNGEYAAAHLLDENGEYPTLSEDIALTVIKKVKVIALNIMARRAAQAVDFTEGETRLEFSKRAKQLEELALKAELDYRKDIDKAVVMQ